MGRSYWFECSKCGYRAKVSGGADRGLHFFVQTVACNDCKQLYDAVIRVRVPDESGLHTGMASWRRPAMTAQRRDLSSPPAFEAVMNQLPYKGVRRFRWLNYRVQCPVSASHRVQAWRAPDKCPRCGLHLERTAMPFRIWE